MKKVEPYYYSYKTFARERWVGRTLYEVFCSEFRGKPKEAYEKAFDEGSIYIVSKGVKQSIDRTYVVKNGDQIVHRDHRHEPVIDVTGLRVIQDHEDYLIVNKPSTVPVHPAGRYHFNTLEKILQLEHNYGKFYIIHRLDVLTSGLIIVAKNYEYCQKACSLFQTNQIRKTYLARVKGRFMYEGLVDQKLECAHFPMTVHGVTPTGKECKTFFKLVRYNAELDESLVECQPLTGRSHQIRVHLRYLGHPIVNDPIYANEELWYGKGTLSFDELFERSEAWMKREAKAEFGSLENRCPECDGTLYDTVKHPGIYLHAWKLLSLNPDIPIDVQSDLPKWAQVI